MNDEELIADAQSNNESFVVLYDKYYDKIFGYAFRRTLDLERAKDVTSETFLKALLNIGKFKWRNIPFSSWLFRIATNEMNMADRKNKYHPQSLQELMLRNSFEVIDPVSLESEKLLIERELKSRADFIQIQKQLKKLPLKYREVIALRYFEDKSIREIGEILDKREGTVKSLLSRGIEQLRSLL